MSGKPIDVAGLRALLAQAQGVGLSMPGEPAWHIEQDRKASARKYLADEAGTWLPGLLDELEALREAVARTDALHNALKVLTKACERADASEDLSYHVDGSMIDCANAALEMQHPVIWTDEQVEALKAFQECGHAHPFTCPNRGDDLHKAQAEEDCEEPGLLYPTVRGWACPACDYRQFWAHEFMFKGAPPHPLGDFRRARAAQEKSRVE